MWDLHEGKLGEVDDMIRSERLVRDDANWGLYVTISFVPNKPQTDEDHPQRHEQTILTRYSNFVSRYFFMVSLVSGTALLRYVLRSLIIWNTQTQLHVFLCGLYCHSYAHTSQWVMVSKPRYWCRDQKCSLGPLLGLRLGLAFFVSILSFYTAS